jgi:hypothetical protein
MSEKDIRVQGFEAHRISKHSVHEDDKFVGPLHRPPLTPRKCLHYSFLLDAEYLLIIKLLF